MSGRGDHSTPTVYPLLARGTAANPDNGPHGLSSLARGTIAVASCDAVENAVVYLAGGEHPFVTSRRKKMHWRFISARGNVQ
ncbi:hypothetical protein KCP69_08160 [Salmonella enterica subsp. enterica]|nr:hypothetical protein KCP69_08160 [Salmonella enterica subsp. enterica]